MAPRSNTPCCTYCSLKRRLERVMQRKCHHAWFVGSMREWYQQAQFSSSTATLSTHGQLNAGKRTKSSGRDVILLLYAMHCMYNNSSTAAATARTASRLVFSATALQPTTTHHVKNLNEGQAELYGNSSGGVIHRASRRLVIAQ